MTIEGVKEMNRAINRLAPELQKSAEVAVLRAGAKPILKKAKQNVTVGDSGLLKKSLGIGVRKVKGRTTARIGPRTGFAKVVTRNGKEVRSDPNKYSHLVEFGTSHSAAKPFIRPAEESAKGEVIDAMAQGYNKHLIRVANRIRSKL